MKFAVIIFAENKTRLIKMLAQIGRGSVEKIENEDGGVKVIISAVITTVIKNVLA